MGRNSVEGLRHVVEAAADNDDPGIGADFAFLTNSFVLVDHQRSQLEQLLRIVWYQQFHKIDELNVDQIFANEMYLQWCFQRKRVQH